MTALPLRCGRHIWKPPTLKLALQEEEASQPRSDRKPPYTYTDLITQALKDKTALTVSGIYQWIT